MAYCTTEDLIARFGERELIQLTDRQGLGTIDPEILAAAIATSDQDIDGALADAGYSTPIVWSRLRVAACALTRAYLFADVRPDLVASEYAEAQSFLAKISEGKIRPPGTVATAGEQPTGGAPEWDAPERLFTSETLADLQ